MKKFLSVFLAMLICLLTASDCGFIGPTALFADDEAADIGEGVLAFPDRMKGSVITVGGDFFTDPSQSAATTQAEIDEILSDFEQFGLDTVIINTSHDGNIYYEIDQQLFTNGSPLTMLIDSAVSRNFFIYISFDLGDAVKASDADGVGRKIDHLAYCVHRLTSKYLIDRII